MKIYEKNSNENRRGPSSVINIKFKLKIVRN